MRSASLTRRAIVAVLLAELLCGAVFAGTALLHERRARLRAFDVMLEGRSDSLLGAVQDAEDPDDNVTIDPTELRVPPEDVFAVYNLGGRLLGNSAGAPPSLTQREAAGFSNRHVGRHTYRVLERDAMRVIDRAENGGVGLRRPITILYAAGTDHIWHETIEGARFYLVMSLCLFALTAGLMIMLLRRVLEPIQQLAVQAAGISMNSLRFEAPAAALRTRELQPLAEALSATIARLRLSVEQEHRFVSDAAHELKTGVAVVRSTIQVLMMRSRSRAEYAEGLERLLEDNGRVEELVARMLTLARLEEGGSAGATVMDLAMGVNQAVASLLSFAEERRVALGLSIATDVPVLLSTEVAEVIVSNLVVNAVQHSGPGSSVAISLERCQRTAVLRVSDQGSGIATEALPHVFERFYREDVSRSRNTGGAGLGLAICKSAVESAGGVISIESRKGVGTTVVAVFSLA